MLLPHCTLFYTNTISNNFVIKVTFHHINNFMTPTFGGHIESLSYVCALTCFYNWLLSLATNGSNISKVIRYFSRLLWNKCRVRVLNTVDIRINFYPLPRTINKKLKGCFFVNPLKGVWVNEEIYFKVGFEVRKSVYLLKLLNEIIKYSGLFLD